MRLICLWCFLVAATAQDDGFYAPQTFKQQVEPSYRGGLFSPANNDVTPQSTIVEPWRPKIGPAFESWGGSAQSQGAPRPEPWRLPYSISKEQQAAILHHKQALSSEGSFQYEYASDNGLAAGEVIQPDGSRVGSYQYKDPSGQIVKLKYKAGKEGFQILEGSHLPKQPEPVPPLNQDQHYIHAYEQQRQQYEIQQQYNQQKPEQQTWRPNQQNYEGQQSQQQHYQQNSWREGQEDDGQYRENDVYNKGPHTFGEGYAFAFKG
ncbi:transcription factor SPT20 homolog [Amyelois transitella]|uniref:transcription factor SPT20 homolog n=1 Tax=Amyelois transitella TaxID=680683 RepID=UPI00298FD312|nr:transcription factor SPT20 homolog [Amyelois transitella]